MGRGSSSAVWSPSSVWSPLRRTGWLGLYIFGLTATAVGLGVYLLIAQIGRAPSVTAEVFAWPGWILLAGIGILTERYTMRFGPGHEVSAGLLAFFLAGAIIGPLASFSVAIISQLVPSRRDEWQRNLCFASAAGIAGGASASVYWVLVSAFGTSELIVAFWGLLAGILFQVLNYLVFVPILWLRRGVSPKALWLEGFQPFLPFHFFFLAISLGLIFIYRNYVLGSAANDQGLLLKSTLLIIVCLLPVLGLIYAFRAFAHQRELARHNARLALRNERLALQAVASQVTALDLKDNYTARHSAAVAQWATDIAEAIGLNNHDLNVTQLASLVHDVGKIGVPDEVLNCPGRLDPVSWAMMETHCQNGERILSNIDQFDELAKVVLYHHERYDGTGYPMGAAGEEIPLISRIICVADSYSAMVSDRPYRAKLSVATAKAELEDKKGTQFDPALVDVFLDLLEQHDEFYQRGEHVDFHVEFQKVRFLRELPPEPEEGGKTAAGSDA